jgi:hypothetical protein
MKRSPASVLAISIVTVSAVALSAPPPTVAAAVPACAAGQLSARIVDWAAAMGSRIADVVIVNTSFTRCSLRDDPRVQLVSASGHVLLNGSPASTSAATHGFNPLAVFKAEVADGTYCGPAYVTPVTLAFVLPGTAGRVIAIPASPPYVSGVPPCNGAPGSARHISMHAWHT